MAETAIERAEKGLEVIQAFLDLLDTAEKQNCELIDLVKECDNEQQDLLHEFELDKFYRDEGHRKARRLQRVRQTRRVAKDTIELWMPMKEVSKANKKLKQMLNEVIGQVKHKVYEHNTRIYQPRGLENCEIAGKHFEPRSIDISERVAGIEERRKSKKA